MSIEWVGPKSPRGGGGVFFSQEVETWEVTHRLPSVTIQGGRLWGNAKIRMLVDEECSIEVIAFAVFSFDNSYHSLVDVLKFRRAPDI